MSSTEQGRWLQNVYRAAYKKATGNPKQRQDEAWAAVAEEAKELNKPMGR